LISFAARISGHRAWSFLNPARADNARVLERRVDHPVPGKLAALESGFRETAGEPLAKDDLQDVACWVPEDASALDHTFMNILMHPSREPAQKNWHAMRREPAFQLNGEIRAG
jgi:hypothetical protein